MLASARRRYISRKVLRADMESAPYGRGRRLR